MTQEETCQTELDQNDLFEWQTRQTAIWERWWRRRIEDLTWRPLNLSEEQSHAFLTRLVGTLESSVLHSARLLSETALDPDGRFMEASRRRRGHGKIVDDWFLSCEHSVQADKLASVRCQIKVSAEAERGAGETVEDVLELLLQFELHCLPVYLYTTLQVVRPIVNETPMLAGLACARIITGKNHREACQNRAKLTNALAWMSDAAKPTDAQLRRTLRQQALKGIFLVLPFVTLQEMSDLMQDKIQEIVIKEPKRLTCDQQDRLSRLLGPSEKVPERLTLRYDAQTANALGNLPNSVSQSIISQCERTNKCGVLRAEAETNFMESTEGGNLLAQQKAVGKNPLETVLAKDKASRYMTAMNEQERIAVALFSDGYSYAEIAARTCVPVGTVRQRLTRGRVKAEAVRAKELKEELL